MRPGIEGSRSIERSFANHHAIDLDDQPWHIGPCCQTKGKTRKDLRQRRDVLLRGGLPILATILARLRERVVELRPGSRGLPNLLMTQREVEKSASRWVEPMALLELGARISILSCCRQLSSLLEQRPRHHAIGGRRLRMHPGRG